MFQAENDPKPAQSTAPDSFTDCEDIKPTLIIPAVLEKKVNVADDFTDYEVVKINTNKPPQGKLFQDETAKQVINFDDYKKDKQPFEVMPADNVASEDLPIHIKVVERVVPNVIKHVKNTFDEVVSQFTKALHSPIRVKSDDISNIISNGTQDVNKAQRKKSNVSLVGVSDADAEIVLCSVDGKVKNEQDENENTYCRIDLPSQENIDVLNGNDATLKNVSDSSDEESTPKKSKRFTFTDSDLPDSDEIRDILMSYPKPTVVESFSESESENSSEDESYKFLRRCMNKTVPVTKIDLNRMIGIEKLPVRVMTRLRKPPIQLLSRGEVSNIKATILKPSYLSVRQEDQMDEDIILENIKRFKSFKKTKTYKASSRKKTDNKSNEHKRKVKVKIGKPERKGKKSKTKSFARKNTKESMEQNFISAGRWTRSMKKENDVKNTKNKCKFPEYKNKKPEHKRKPYKKERTIFPEIEGRRSRRQQKVKEKNDETMNASISIPKKNIPKQSYTVYNVSSSGSESPKSLKRSLVDGSDEPSPKRTRSHNSNNNNSIKKASLRMTTARVVKRQNVHLHAFPGKKHKQDKIVRYEPAQKRSRTLNSNRNYLTRSQLARRRFHRACKRTREAARTSTKRL